MRTRTRIIGKPWLLLALSCFALLLAGVYLGGRWLETRTSRPEPRGDHMQRYQYDQLVELEDGTYRAKKNMTTVLLIGIDRSSDQESKGFRNGGQADFLRLVVIDRQKHMVDQISIDRDTMASITILGVLGDVSGQREAQICLSHGFGNGKEQSCELTVEAVSRLLFDAPIDHYVAMDLDGIAALNDAVGGVTVRITEDFTGLDPAMRQGAELTLDGRQAELFVRSRRDVGQGTNQERMVRQQQYLSQLSQLVRQQMVSDSGYAGRVYDQLQPYLTTDLSRGELINLASAAMDYERPEPVTPEGTHQQSEDGFVEFYPDMDKLHKLVIDLFFERIF